MGFSMWHIIKSEIMSSQIYATITIVFLSGILSLIWPDPDIYLSGIIVFGLCIAWLTGNSKNDRISPLRLPISLNQIVIIRTALSCAYYLVFFISVLGSYGIWVSSDISNSQFWKMALPLLSILIFANGLIRISFDLAHIWTNKKSKLLSLLTMLLIGIPSIAYAFILTITPKPSSSSFHTIEKLQHQLSDMPLTPLVMSFGIILFYISTITYKHRKSYIG